MKPTPEDWVVKVAAGRLVTEFVLESREEPDCPAADELAVGVHQRDEFSCSFILLTREKMAHCVVEAGGDPEGILDAPVGMVPVLFVGVSGKSTLSYWADAGFKMVKGGVA